MPAPGQRQRLPRAGDADVKQPPLLVHRAFHFRAVVRQQPLLQPDEINVRKLQSLRRVQRDQRHAAALRFFVLLLLLAQHHVIEKIAQALAFGLLVILKPPDHFHDLVLPLQPLVLRLARALEVGEVARLPDERAQHLGLLGKRGVQLRLPRIEKARERRDRLRCPLAQSAPKLPVLQRRKHAAPLVDAQLRGALHDRWPDAACRRVDDPQQRNVVVRVQQHARVGQQILDLPRVEKTAAADHAIRNVQLAQMRLDHPRLGVHAEEDREVLVLRALGHGALGNLAGDEIRLLPVIAHPDHAHLCAALVRAPELLRTAARVVFDERVGRAKDGVRRAVILLQLDHRRVRKVRLEFEDVAHLRAAPAVDGLVVVAHHRHVLPSVREVRHEFELEPVGVLKFVHHEVAKFPLPLLAHRRVLGEQLVGEQQQIVKIHRVHRLQLLLVFRKHRRRQRLLVARRHLAPPVALRFTDQALRHIRLQLFILRRRAGDDLFDQPGGVALVVNAEVSFVAQLVDVLPQHPHAERVKGGHGHRLGLLRRDQFRQPLAHFLCRLVRESDRKDLRRVHALRDEKRHACRDDARLPGARAGEDEQRTLGRAHGAFLLGIEVEKSEAGHEGRENGARHARRK